MNINIVMNVNTNINTSIIMNRNRNRIKNRYKNIHIFYSLIHINMDKKVKNVSYLAYNSCKG